MPSTIIYRGANRLFSFLLTTSDGVTPLAVASLTAVSIDLVQNRVVKDTLVRGTDNELRNGVAANELILELTSALSAALAPGLLTARFHFTVPDEDFDVDVDIFKDILEVDIATIK